MHKPPFIVFEGIDGSGKSTQLQLLAERLQQEGREVHTCCEPTDGAIGVMIRSILRGKQQMDERVIAALFAADRLDHITNPVNGLQKQLASGKTVLCDRYYLSSFAYNGAHVPLEWVIDLNKLSRELLEPDLHVFVDVSPEVSLARITRNREDVERYETQSNLERVRANYLTAIDKLGARVVMVNGDQTMEQVAEEIWSKVSERLFGKSH